MDLIGASEEGVTEAGGLGARAIGVAVNGLVSNRVDGDAIGGLRIVLLGAGFDGRAQLALLDLGVLQIADDVAGS